MMIKQTLLYSLNIKNLRSKDSTLDEWARKWKNENSNCEVLFMQNEQKSEEKEQYLPHLLMGGRSLNMKVANTHD